MQQPMNSDAISWQQLQTAKQAVGGRRLQLPVCVGMDSMVGRCVGTGPMYPNSWVWNSSNARGAQVVACTATLQVLPAHRSAGLHLRVHAGRVVPGGSTGGGRLPRAPRRRCRCRHCPRCKHPRGARIFRYSHPHSLE